MTCRTIGHWLRPATLFGVVLMTACAQPDAEMQASPAVPVPLYSDLGSHHYSVTTANEQAQQYFDQGLRLTYGFNHGEAIRAYSEAARLDPSCAMCYWGIALAHGPNINAPMDEAAGVAAYTAAQEALRLASGATEREQALIRAIASRYSDPPAADRTALDQAYATAMGELARTYPEDDEIAALYAESLMDLSPWDYWSTAGEPHERTPDILAALEGVLARNPNHPGACHFYIHAVEAAQPERAVPCAERLAGLMPGAGHLVHMPAHIYIRVGRWNDAIESNIHAVHQDETYIRDQQPGLGVYVLGYYPHNSDFLAFANTMAGRSREAIEAARKVESLVPTELLREPGMGFLQQSFTGPLRLLVRFGHWDEILREEAPPEDLPYARAIWHFAHAMALAARGDLDGAEADLAQVRSAQQHPALGDLIVGFNSAADVTGIAANVLAGEIAARRGNLSEAIARLREAAQQEDLLTYGEPPDWPVPVRHYLGAVLLEANQAVEAERAYREDLARFPENGWSLRGLSNSLTAQGRTSEASAVDERLARAWAQADVSPTTSRF